ncbi:hypothetical protein DY000_02040416 [Brassica cretica]|uniref:Uncharacterized protein n=1 Tax=Brassica cretica TaxID=69181 RepID=A0ABQ7BQS8_BRACR|nr:hypothetical protein DY000_02040416 [Brassica cretica]
MKSRSMFGVKAATFGMLFFLFFHLPFLSLLVGLAFLIFFLADPDVSDSLTEVLREETRLPHSVGGDTKPSSGDVVSVGVVRTISLLGSDGRDHRLNKAKIANMDLRSSSSNDGAGVRPFHWRFSEAKDFPITKDPDSVAHLVRHFKYAGSLFMSLRNMMECDTCVKTLVAHAKNEFGATLEQMLKDVKCDDELNKVKKVKLGNQVVSLEARLRMIWNERKAALERVSLLEAQIENSSAKHVEDLRLASYEANKILADSYLDVL